MQDYRRLQAKVEKYEEKGEDGPGTGQTPPGTRRKCWGWTESRVVPHGKFLLQLRPHTRCPDNSTLPPPTAPHTYLVPVRVLGEP